MGEKERTNSQSFTTKDRLKVRVVSWRMQSRRRKWQRQSQKGSHVFWDWASDLLLSFLAAREKKGKYNSFHNYSKEGCISFRQRKKTCYEILNII